MIPRAFLRPLSRAISRPTYQIPLKPPRISNLPSTPLKNTPSVRPYAKPSRPGRPRRKWGQPDPEELRNARPLLTSEQLSHIAQHPGLKLVGLIIVGGGTFFYFSNQELVPVSGRKRFNCLSDKYIESEAKEAYEMIMRAYEGDVLPDWDERTKIVRGVMERLIPESGVQDVNWEVHVIDSEERNAFIIPGGKVFVFTGMLDITQNDDGLAAVLGHEIAHNLAKHHAETMSQQVYLLPLQYLLYLGDATGYTLGLGRIFGWFVMRYGIMSPASRVQESEADFIGLMMMAKSCYDPSEAVRIWQRMEVVDKEENESPIPQWMSTHPSNANRITQIQAWLAEAEDKRQDSGCALSLSQSRGFSGAISDWSSGQWGS